MGVTMTEKMAYCISQTRSTRFFLSILDLIYVGHTACLRVRSKEALKGLQLEVGAQRDPRLGVFDIPYFDLFFHILITPAVFKNKSFIEQ